MREKETILIYQYIINNHSNLEEELRELQQRFRYRKADINDCIEMMLLKQRLETFKQVTTDIVHLLNLKKISDFE